MSQPRIGLALAGGGPLGAIYEVGALCALEEAVDGLDFTACDGYIGVSAGGFIAAGLANGMTPRQLCAAFIENTAEAPDRFDPAELLQPAWAEFGQRLSLLPRLLRDAAREVLLEGRSRLSAIERLGRVLPTGLLSSERFGEALTRVFAVPGRTNDFRELGHRLVLVATDLDTGEAVPFGTDGWDHVPISEAVQASAALPGLFPPVEIDGRHYVDGALKKTLHASVLLDRGLDLLICLNPLVPYASDRLSHRERRSRHAKKLASKLGRAAGRALQPRIHRLGRRPAAGAVADLPLADPLAAGAGPARLRAQPPADRHRAVRARPAGRRVLPRQHLQLQPAPPPRRARLPVDT